jgi:hypothetical protein
MGHNHRVGRREPEADVLQRGRTTVRVRLSPVFRLSAADLGTCSGGERVFMRRGDVRRTKEQRIKKAG